MSTLRIFISSPNDVAEERTKARQVIESLERHYERLARLEVVMWEDLALSIDLSAQQSIARVLSEKDGVHIAVFILWSRLGSELSEKATPRPGGGGYRSGTEHEFELMLAARRESGGRKPHILAYWRQDEKSFIENLKHESPADYTKLLKQRELARLFIEERFMDEQGRNIRGLHMFAEPVSFAQRLDRHLRQVLDELLSADQTDSSWTGAPYRSLEVFEIEHAPIFYGRDEETCDVLQRLRDQERAGCAFVCIVGASGSGKSSLARAGVAATLVKRSFDEGVKEWRAATFLPSLASGDLCAGLARSLAEQLPELREGVGGLERFEKRLEDNPEAAGDLLETSFKVASDKLSGSLRVLLVLDQMEELWTDRRVTTEQREKFLQSIEALARRARLSVLATLRSDFYPQAQLSEAFLKMKGERGHFDLTPPGTAALHDLIIQPAHRAGLSFERDERTGRTLDQRILEDAARDPSALPLLQYALAELYERRDDKHHLLTFGAYEALGSVEGALGQRAAQTFDSLPDEARAALDELLPQLISVDVTGEQNAVRRRAPLDDLTNTAARRQLTERLIAARFLTTDEQSGTPVATLAHEALLRRWDRITTWINTNRNLLRLRATVEHSQSRWEQSGANPSLLLPTGLPLEEGRRLIAEGITLLSQPTALFIRTSIDHQESEDRRRTRFRRQVIGGLAALALLAIGAGWYAWGKKTQAQLAEGKERDSRVAEGKARKEQQRMLHEASLADYSTAVEEMDHGRNWEEGVTHLARALVWDPSNKLAATRLYQALAFEGEKHAHHLKRTLAHNAPVSHVSFSPNGKHVATLSGNTVQLWDAVTGNPTGPPLAHDEGVNSIEFSTKEARFLTCTTKVCRLWDVSSSNLLSDKIQFEDEDTATGGFQKATFSPDGSKILTLAGTGDIQAVHLWSSQSGELSPLTADGVGLWFKFSPSGQRLVTVTRNEATLWDPHTGKELGVCKQKQQIGNVQFSSDGLVFATSDGVEAKLWSAANAKPLAPKWFTEPKAINAFCSATGGLMLLVDEDTRVNAEHNIRVIEVSTGKPNATDLSIGEPVARVRFSPDLSKLLVVGSQGRAHLFSHGRLLSEVIFDLGQPDSIEFNRDASKIITCGAGRADLWDGNNGHALGGPFWHEGKVSSAVFSPDGLIVLTGGHDGTARFWDARQGRATGVRLFYTNTSGNAPKTPARGTFSPNEKIFALASDARCVRLFDVGTGKQIGYGFCDTEPITDAVFAPDSSRLATLGHTRTRVWDLATGHEVSQPFTQGPPAASVTFSQNGAFILTTSNGAAQVWDAGLGTAISQPLAPALDHAQYESIKGGSFSADATRIVLFTGTNHSVWDWRRGLNIKAGFRTDELSDESRLTADGSLLLSAGFNAYVWRVESGELLTEKEGGFSTISDDASRIFVATADDSARMIKVGNRAVEVIAFQLPEPCNSGRLSGDGQFLATVHGSSSREEGKLDAIRLWDTETLHQSFGPFREEHLITRSWLSSHGAALVSQCDEDGFARIYDLAFLRNLPLPVPPWLPEFAQAIAGRHFDAEGRMLPISPANWTDIMIRKYPDSDPWSRLARWLAQDPEAKTIAPESDLTFRQMAEAEQAFRTNGTVSDLLRFNPSH